MGTALVCARLPHQVLQVVANNVRLLQEEAHVVGARQVLCNGGGLGAGCREKLGEPFSDQAGNVVAVAVVLGHIVRALAEVGADELGHAAAHEPCDVAHHGSLAPREGAECAGEEGQVFQEAPLVTLAHSVDGKVRVVELAPEGTERDAFGRVRDGGVVLDRVQCAEGEIEDADGTSHGRLQLVDD